MTIGIASKLIVIAGLSSGCVMSKQINSLIGVGLGLQSCYYAKCGKNTTIFLGFRVLADNYTGEKKCNTNRLR